MKKILSIVGARPNFVKIAALYHAFRPFPAVAFKIVHTGQHHDVSMSSVFFRDFQLPAPDHYLGITATSPVLMIAQMLLALEPVLRTEQPDLVLVVGDTNSTLAGALAAAKMGIPIAHVEAGLRSGDRSMPEEFNRIMTDSVADFLFVTEQSGLDNLQREGYAMEKVFFVGNCMLDMVLRYQPAAAATGMLGRLQLTPRTYCLLTFHRPSNVDSPAALEQLVRLIELAVRHTSVVFPLHPRVRINLNQSGLRKRLDELPNLHLLEPQAYPEFLSLLENAALVITDSGGVQEETTFLRVPCLTFRRNTERPITVSMGTNELLPSLDPEQAVEKLKIALRGEWKSSEVPPLWDGQAGRRIADILGT